MSVLRYKLFVIVGKQCDFNYGTTPERQHKATHAHTSLLYYRSGILMHASSFIVRKMFKNS